MEREEFLSKLAVLEYVPVASLELERVEEENYILSCGLTEKERELAEKASEVEHLKKELKRAAVKIFSLTEYANRASRLGRTYY